MGVRIGMDLVDIGEVREAYLTFGERYVERIAQPVERAWCLSRGGIEPAQVAMLFAGKEAVAKVLAPAEGDALPFSQIVLKAQAGVVDVHLEGEAAELAHRRGVTSVTVSVACAGESAVATALARTSNPTAGNR